MLYKNTKVMVRFPDSDTDFFNIVAGILEGNTSAPYIIIICQDYVLQTLIDPINENGFTLKRSRRFTSKSITDANFADDLELITEAGPL